MSHTGTTVPITESWHYVPNRPIHEGGVPVHLGQVIDSQLGLICGEAVVNIRLPGQTPVTAYANAQAIATSGIIGTRVSDDLVYFEASLVSSTQFHPCGYSKILDVLVSGAS